MSGVELHAFDDREALTAALAVTCAEALAHAIAKGGRASAALSGGSTPAPLYLALAACPLDWTKVDLALVDERWVDPADKASNEGLLRACFAPALRAGASFTAMKTAAASPAEALAEREPAHAALRPLDLVVLGMGPDGHTASWFPNAEGLDAALDPENDRTLAAVRAVHSAVAGAYVERMTLTRPAVVEAARVVMMITGEDKRDAFERARAAGPENDAPVRALWRDADSDLDVYWAP